MTAEIPASNIDLTDIQYSSDLANSSLHRRADARDRKGLSMSEPGKNNLITDIDGIQVGNAHDAAAKAGTSVIV